MIKSEFQKFQMAVVLALTLISVWVFFDAKSRGMWP